jgi:hypothetical protein
VEELSPFARKPGSEDKNIEGVLLRPIIYATSTRDRRSERERVPEVDAPLG